ncbi:MAG: hypothetical protein N2691_01540 [Patescibacteria group bacterium]|nr:hypothetical protein [Patescibacteria group bacterium]
MRNSPTDSYAIVAGICILTVIAIALIAIRASSEVSAPSDTKRIPADRTHDEYSSSISSRMSYQNH